MNLKIHGTDRFDSLDSAQRAGTQAIAASIARSVRAGIQSGRYVEIDGVVRLSDRSKMDTGKGETDAVSA